MPRDHSPPRSLAEYMRGRGMSDFRQANIAKKIVS